MRKMVRTGIIILGVIIVALVVGMGTGIINLQTLTIGQPLGSGIQVPPDRIPLTGAQFTGQLNVDVQHRDALDNAETRDEGIDLATTFYKSLDGINFNSIGDGSSGLITIDSRQDSILYASPRVLDPFFIAPLSTANPQLNPRITDFAFDDITNDGIREWYFKIDLKDLPEPIGGQTGSTLSLFINSYNFISGATLNSPANITGVPISSGIVNFIRWELTLEQESANAQTEYSIRMVGTGNDAETEQWDVGQSSLEIPNIGMVSLSDFEEFINPNNILYQFKVGETATLGSANYLTTAQNGNTVHPIPFKFVTNFDALGLGDILDVTLSIKSIGEFGQSQPLLSDIVNVQVT
jgi:hypothetical protein